MLEVYSKQELDEIIRNHGLWLRGKGGVKANFRFADLRSADLSCANLRSANFRSANLSSANLSSADLSSADLHFADLTRVSKLCLAKLSIVPETGSFTGYKKSAEGFIIKLEIISRSKRLNPIGHRKCRAEIVIIKEFLDTELIELSSYYDPDFKYRVGHTLMVENFNESLTDACGAGIHFFTTQAEAENY